MGNFLMLRGRYLQWLLIVLLVMPVRSGAQTSQDIDFLIVRAEGVKISDLEDWFLGAHTSATANIRFDDWACVFSSTGGYSLRVISDNGGGQLHLENGAGDELRYRLAVRHRRGAPYRNRNFTNADQTRTGMTGASAADCSDQPANRNIRFRTVVRRADFNNAPTGIYTDSVTLIISPE